VPIYGTSGVVLLDAATGGTLATLPTKAGTTGSNSDFAQPTFANGFVFTASATDGMVVYQLPG